MKNFIQPGEVVTLPAPAGGCKSGDVITVGKLIGVAAYDAVAGADVETQLVGVFELPKASATTFSAGAPVSWVSGAAAASGTPIIGAAVAAAGSGGLTVRVRLDGTSLP